MERMGGAGRASWYNCSSIADDRGGGARVAGSAILSEEPPDREDGDVELEVPGGGPSGREGRAQRTRIGARW